jgi:hypothetical protein
MRDHVIYESRLELSRLIFADFDREVHRILAQPFLLKAEIGGKIRKHIPDYFLVTDHGPVVVDVKPGHLLARPKVACTFEWTRRMVEARGWRPTAGACRTFLSGLVLFGRALIVVYIRGDSRAGESRLPLLST